METAQLEAMDDSTAVAHWWQAVEDDAAWLKRAAGGEASPPIAGPDWSQPLARARACDLYLRVDEGRALLASIDDRVPAGSWPSTTAGSTRCSASCRRKSRARYAAPGICAP